MPRTPRWPMDYELIQKDQVITPRDVAMLVGEPIRSYDYAYKLAALIKELTDQLWAIGKCFTVRLSKGNVVVLNDSDALRYNVNRFYKAWDSMRDAVRHLENIDQENYSERDTKYHAEKLGMMRHILAEMEAARRNRPPDPPVYRRNTPVGPQ